MKDDHESRQCCFSIVFHFPNPPSNKHQAAAPVLKNTPIRELRCDSEFTRGSGARDHLMDPKQDPANGQAYHFPTKKTKPPKPIAG